MAAYDFGGGCPCGLSRECDCGRHTPQQSTSGPQKVKVVTPTETKIKSDGGSTDYYKIPSGATDLIDLIEHKKMGFSLGNIFKACYRLGEKDGNNALYDINKIIFFATRLKNEIEKSR